VTTIKLCEKIKFCGKTQDFLEKLPDLEENNAYLAWNGYIWWENSRLWNGKVNFWVWL